MIPSPVQTLIKLLKQYRQEFAEASSSQQTIAAAEQIKRTLRDIGAEIDRDGVGLAGKHRRAHQQAVTWIDRVLGGYEFYTRQPFEDLPQKASVGRLDFDFLAHLLSQVWVR